jgi:hypothetical protein
MVGLQGFLKRQQPERPVELAVEGMGSNADAVAFIARMKVNKPNGNPDYCARLGIEPPTLGETRGDFNARVK